MENSVGERKLRIRGSLTKLRLQLLVGLQGGIDEGLAAKLLALARKLLGLPQEEIVRQGIVPSQRRRVKTIGSSLRPKMVGRPVEREIGVVLFPACVVRNSLLGQFVDSPHKEELSLEALVGIIHRGEVRLVGDETKTFVRMAAVIIILLR